jgi:hypothetical protein
VFDFGDSWEFWVTVLQVDPAAPEPKSPEVVDKQGKNPKQYSVGSGRAAIGSRHERLAESVNPSSCF